MLHFALFGRILYDGPYFVFHFRVCVPIIISSFLAHFGSMHNLNGRISAKKVWVGGLVFAPALNIFY